MVMDIAEQTETETAVGEEEVKSNGNGVRWTWVASTLASLLTLGIVGFMTYVLNQIDASRAAHREEIAAVRERHDEAMKLVFERLEAIRGEVDPAEVVKAIMSVHAAQPHADAVHIREFSSLQARLARIEEKIDRLGDR